MTRSADVRFVGGLLAILIGSVVGVSLLVGTGRYAMGLAVYAVLVVIGGWFTVSAIRAEMEAGGSAGGVGTSRAS